jgi:hypothetical protein
MRDVNLVAQATHVKPHGRNRGTGRHRGSGDRPQDPARSMTAAIGVQPATP